MFSGFWGWFLVVVVIIAIFNAGRLPELKALFDEKLNKGIEAAKKGKKEIEEKINEKRKK